MDVELVLPPDDGGVDHECDLIAFRRPSVRAFEERSSAPSSVEIVRRSSQLQERVLNADDLSRRGDDQVVQQRRPQDDVAAFITVGKIDLEARKGSRLSA